jgi:TldD protein
MPTCAHSAFLEGQKPLVAEAVRILARRFDYVSILGTDDAGVSFRASRGETAASEPMWVQRGFVVRAQMSAHVSARQGVRAEAPTAGRIVEYAFNDLPEGRPEDLAARIEASLWALLESGSSQASYPPIPDEPAKAERRGSTEREGVNADPEETLRRLASFRDYLLARPDIVSAQTRADFVRVSRFFVSPHRDLFQSFAWGQAYAFGVARRGDIAKTDYRARSGLAGAELLDRLETDLPGLADELGELLGACKVDPGEYEVVMTPDVAGTLAHEAFGHGVETDMFVKRRAKAAEYLGKAVASPIVDMYDGAADVSHTGSFLFDDEGNLGTKTHVIAKGILQGGFSDTLSSLALGIAATGNGRRQAYDHKAYARMTNTYFGAGVSTKEEMIAKVKHGWLLDRLNSGMEDPKNWGIQLIVLIGREIKDGAFTGRVASPVYCSGYVPDVLGAIEMVSRDFELAGSGACGKGYKEFVKVSSGGPYVKTRMRLG